MKILLLLLSMLMSSLECNSLLELPDGFTATNTFEKNGVLTVLDEFGNGANVYLEYSDDPKKENPFDDYYIDVVEDIKFRDGGHLVKFDNKSPVDPFTSAYYFRKNETEVYGFLYMDGPAETHGVFEQKFMELARNLAQGGRDETYSDCWVVPFGSGDWGKSRQG